LTPMDSKFASLDNAFALFLQFHFRPRSFTNEMNAFVASLCLSFGVSSLSFT
jgi:hypothetical protein